MAKKQQIFKRISEFEEGESAITYLAIDSADTRQKSDGSAYMAFRFKDRTGTIEGKIWEKAENYQDLKPGDVVKVEVDVRSYRGKPDLNIRRLRPVLERDFEDGLDLKELQEWSEYDIDELWDRLKQMVDRIEYEPLRHLVHAILGAKEQVIRRVPAAKAMHHPFFGGLLEHTVWVTDNCLRLLDNYRELNRDLVIAGAVLHDIGKTEELGGENVTDYTVDGRLIGHIIIGRDLLLKHAKLIPTLSEDALRHLEHIILGHQGEKEWGTPVLPATPEAFFIHMVDNMDAKMRMFLYAMKKAPEGKLFTDFHRTLERYLYLERPEFGEEEAEE